MKKWMKIVEGAQACLGLGARVLKAAVFIWIYRLLFAPLVLLSLPRYVLHMRRRGGYRERFGTRFGLGLRVPEKAPGKRRVWIQAVSLGEMLAVEPLLRELSSDERLEIYLTTTTSTGYALAKKNYGELVIGVSYFPTDFWPFSRSVWRQIDPDVAVCAETELWPEHIRQANRRGVPFLLVNGRLSDRSFRSMKKLRWLVGGVLSKLTRVYAGSELDRDRFVKLGISPENVENTGNIKLDSQVGPLLGLQDRTLLRTELGLGEGFLLLGSSTWPGEEAMLLKAFEELRGSRPDARLLIVPRHAERRDELERLMDEEASQWRCHFKSRGLPSGDVDILVADTSGELRMLSQLADLAFVGKSLPPHAEGQTPVECGALGVPMVFGLGMSNFRAIAAGLLRSGAARQVASEEEAIRAILDLADDEKSRRAMGEAGLRWHGESRGAVARVAAGIRDWLE